MPKFNKRVFGSHVDPKIIKVFKRLGAGGFKTEADLNKGLKQGDGGAQRDGAADAKILEQQIPSFEKYLGDRTPFTRMWCAVNIRDSGSADKDSDTLVFSVNENRENSYTTNPLSSVLGSEKTGNIRYVSQLSEELGKGNPYVKPAAGITSVTSKTQGALGALQHTTVEFMVHNKYDFENIFLPYFMRPGAIVCVDYGWSTDKGVGLYDPLEQLKDKPLDMSDFDKYIYDEDTGWINRKENFGTVNTTMGNVTNYSANMNNDGSFQCSIEIVSRNAGLLEKELDNENGLRFIFSNVLDDLIITALGVADPSVKATFTNKSVDQIKKIIDQEDPDKATEQYNNYLQQIDFGQQLNPDSKGGVRRDNEAFNIIGDFARKTGIFYQDIDNDTTITNNHLNQIVSNVEFFGMDKGLNDTSDFRSKETLYITYGRFEDMFLNNFVAGVIKEQKDEKGKIIRNQFKRCFHTMGSRNMGYAKT